jgi:hypothetical protein
VPRIEVAPPPLEPPSSDLARARAQREYLDRHLSLRRYGEASLGVGYATAGWWGPRGRFHYGVVPYTRVVRRVGIGVFQGESRIDVPTTLEVLGDDAGYRSLQSRINTNRTLANMGAAVGVAGIGATVVGVVQLNDPFLTFDEALTWRSVTYTGVGMILGGFLAGAIPAGRAQELQFDYDETFAPGELDQRVDRYNEQLASELGIRPTEAVRLEQR